jgi:predicted nucleic acid-binding Zn ribbon protein
MAQQTILRNCPYCGKEFDSYNGIKSYCSEDCKRELNRERNRNLAKKNWRKHHPK